jgi:hypothetical protein
VIDCLMYRMYAQRALVIQFSTVIGLRTDVRFGSKAEILAASTSCPLYPRKQTFAGELGKSALCQ